MGVRGWSELRRMLDSGGGEARPSAGADVDSAGRGPGAGVSEMVGEVGDLGAGGDCGRGWGAPCVAEVDTADVLALMTSPIVYPLSTEGEVTGGCWR